MDVGEALAVIVDRLKRKPAGIAKYGYDIWLPTLWEEHIVDKGLLPRERHHEVAARGTDLSPAFYAAAWELCRRGILRPGVREANAQYTNWSDGYCLTPTGADWLNAVTELQFVTIEPLRTAKMLSAFNAKFGPGYTQRSQEAVKCYFANAFLGCCAMSGAAAESILLAWTVAKIRDEEKVMDAYASSSGRSRVETMLLGQADKHISSRVRSFTDLLKYWRDSTTHGAETTIGEIEAYDAIGRLLRFAHLAAERWNSLL